MFKNLGLHIIRNPTGMYSYVGSIPTVLATIESATRSDVLGGRAFRNEAGDLKTYRFPCFLSEKDARDFAASKGCEVS